MSNDYRPAWVDKFCCARGCKKSFTLREVNTSNTGRVESCWTCDVCKDAYTVYWVRENPGQFIVAARKVKSINRAGHRYYRQWNGTIQPDDLVQTANADSLRKPK